jgi:thioredoxin domain-containing protein 5
LSNFLAKVAEVDCTIHQAVCQQNGIRGYPTLLWFENGKEQSEKYTGARNTEAFLTWINAKVNPTQETVG